MNISLEEQIAAVERVIAKRHNLYPEFMEDSALEIARMEAVLQTLKELLKAKAPWLFDNTTDSRDQIAEAIDR